MTVKYTYVRKAQENGNSSSTASPTNKSSSSISPKSSSSHHKGRSGKGDIGRFVITRSTIIMLFLLCVLIYSILPPWTSDTDSTDPPKQQKESSEKPATGKSKLTQTAKEEEDDEEDEEDKRTSFTLGLKKFKLYDGKKLNFRKAETFCRRMEGRLAMTETLGEMTRLVTLLKQAKKVSDEVWMRQERKHWRPHSLKDKPMPGINKDALKDMGASLWGGDKQEMCPALSSSTRALSPIICHKELPFVCEFDVYVPPPTTTTTPKPSKKKSKNQGKTKSKSTKGTKTAGSNKKPKVSPTRTTTRKPKPKSTTPSRKSAKRTTTTTRVPKVKVIPPGAGTVGPKRKEELLKKRKASKGERIIRNKDEM